MAFVIRVYAARAGPESVPMNLPLASSPGKMRLLPVCSLLGLLLPPLAHAVPVDLGPLTGFYRHTQLQGHLVQNGLELYRVPDFWCAGSDFPYQKKAAAREVFFVDEFSVTRFLGGYNQNWAHQGNQLPANDLAYRNAEGKICYRLHLVRERLAPYLENGYTRFIIGIENVPWALSRDPKKSGPYGATEPPRDWNEWRDFLRAVCGEMARVWPEEVTRHLAFKIGNEYNQKKSFTGSHEDYLKLYDHSAAAIREVFPAAAIMPGEIGGEAAGPDNAVDYPQLFEHLARGKNLAGQTAPSPVAVLARSSHSFPHTRDLSPAERVSASVESFRQVLAGKPEAFVRGLSLEYHQFGVLGAPFTEMSFGPTDARAASWHFQVMFRAKAAGMLDRCWSWSKADKVEFSKTAETHFLTGVGWLFSVFDHLRGDRTWLLDAEASGGPAADVTAAGFVRAGRVVVLLASWSRDPVATLPVTVRVALPRALRPFPLVANRVRILSFTNETCVHGAIRRDLAAANNLHPDFAAHPEMLAPLRQMAGDYLAARAMVAKNRRHYEQAQQACLTLQPVPADGLVLAGAPEAPELQLTTTLAPNEVRVLVFAP